MGARIFPAGRFAGYGGPVGQGEAADVLPPGPMLAALTAQAASAACSLTDSQLIGVLQATRRMANVAAYQQTVVIAEFARRRQAQFEEAKGSGRPVGCRDGEFPAEELAMELVATGPYTSGRIDTAIELVTRLPRTLAGMADGLIDLDRACTIASRTRAMTDLDEYNTSPKCRRHHRTKQAPGWKAAQPTPDTTTWTTPAGRIHTTKPTAYDL